MSLSYCLSSDSPLLRPGVFDRITQHPEDYTFGLTKEESKFGETLPTELKELWSPRYDRGRPLRIISFLQRDEFHDLLSFAGIVWYVAQTTQLDTREAALLVLAGMPWPLWSSRNRQAILLNPLVSMEQAKQLKRIFTPCEEQELEVILKILKGHLRRGDSRQDRYYREIASRTKQQLAVVRAVGVALRHYVACLVTFSGHIL